MKTLMNCLAIGGAGFFGAIARYGISRFTASLFPKLSFPLGTFLINVTGSFLLGWFVTYAAPRVSEPVRLAIGVGFVGAYTTFSTYMYETDALSRNGQQMMATVYLVSSIVLGLIAVRLGVALGS